MTRKPLPPEEEHALWRMYWSYRLPKNPNNKTFDRRKPTDQKELEDFIYAHQLLNNEKHLNIREYETNR